ncbi:MAG TPA: hypothetical protein VLG09_01900, partial [Candidatus Saccharimonadales bacterium]|nr:hypothetical protein [Candidatus Saccharimonadales bacterium]
MPAELDACVQKLMADGKDEQSAYAICNSQLSGGSNFVEQIYDANGDLYLKYFFADSSLTERPSAVGHFSIDKQALAAKDHEAIGLPFVILPRRDLSIKNDFHAWSPKDGATWEDHVAFAKSYSPGHIVAITPDTKLMGAGIDSIKQNNGRFAIVKITDQRARDAFRNNPALIPRAVSPGFMNLETPNLEGIKNFRWAHLAAVPRGAYGDKATVYASCLGGNECVNHLVGASVVQLDEQLKNSYCPIGAAESIANTSLGNFSGIKNSMSANATNTTEPSPPTTTTPVVSTVSAPPKGAPINTGTQSKGIVKLKNPVQQGQAVTPQGNNPQGQGQGDSVNELEAVKKTLQELQAAQQQRERLEQIKKVIPKELFINKGRFDEKGYEAEVEKRLQQGWTDEQLNEFYA